MKKFQKSLKTIALSILKILIAAWTFGLIWFSALLAESWLWNQLLAFLWLAITFSLPFIPKLRKYHLLIPALLALPFLIAYLSLRPSNQRKWETPTARTSSAEVSGDTLTIREFRDFDYAKGKKPVPQWSTRSFDLSKLEAMDVFITYWGSEWASHPIFSFDFGQDGHLAFSIEARREDFESYSVLGGLYRRYELIYIPCAETDAVRVRSNFRKNETVYLYRTVATPIQARARLLEFVETTNQIKAEPRFYNILLSNCTTAVRSQMKTGFAFDWRIILNGKMDEMLYQRNMLETGGLTFPELKKRNFINPIAKEHPQKEGYSEHIRQGLAGFPK